MEKVMTLDPKAPAIIVRTYSITKERWYTAQTTFERAMEMVNRGDAAVQRPDMIVNLVCWKDIKKIVRKRDFGICRYCHKPGDTVDHVDPRAKNGLTNLRNCVCSCRECNELKKDMTLVKFLRLYPEKKHPFRDWNMIKLTAGGELREKA